MYIPYWSLEENERWILFNLRDDVEKTLSGMSWLVNEDERRSDSEKIILLSCQLEELTRSFHRMVRGTEQLMLGEDNCFLCRHAKEEVKYYN